MVTLKDAWNSYVLMLQSLRKSAATKTIQYGWAAILTFAHKQNYLYVDHQLKNLLQLYCDYLKDTYSNINTFNHKIATLRGFVDFIFYENGWSLLIISIFYSRKKTKRDTASTDK